MDTVSSYDLLGFVEDLPSLLVGRYGHGCGSYMRGDGTQVRGLCIVLMVSFLFRSSWLLEDGTITSTSHLRSC